MTGSAMPRSRGSLQTLRASCPTIFRSRCQPVGSSSGRCDQPIGKEDEPARRTYWVFLPPVDRERGPNGIPLFNGSQPVVGVEVRQLTLAPPVARN
jgi:hypothetical protein